LRPSSTKELANESLRIAPLYIRRHRPRRLHDVLRSAARDAGHDDERRSCGKRGFKRSRGQLRIEPGPASAYRSGYGIVESISLVTLPASAAAGGTLPPVVSGPYRITMRMDDGSIQTMVVDNRAFLVGDRVQIMSDGRLIRP
jgi:hypothetical protein